MIAWVDCFPLRKETPVKDSRGDLCLLIGVGSRQTQSSGASGSKASYKAGKALEEHTNMRTKFCVSEKAGRKQEQADKVNQSTT